VQNYDLPIYKNPLKNRKDMQEAIHQICNPLKPFFSPGRAHLLVTNEDILYTGGGMIQSLIRPLWGLIPFSAGGGDTDLWNYYLEGIRNGTNPEHPEYWGERNDLTEYPVIGYALAMVPDKIWDPLDCQEKQNLSSWLYRINQYSLWDNNFLFFRVLTNAGLKKVGMKYDQKAMDQALDRIEAFYLSDGWYSDGLTNQRDYYISFAIHYYSLIYARLMEQDDPVRSQRYKERARLFARDFIYWFASDGSALPFGRSLTYKFAQTAFWGALAFANVEAFPWGVIKGIVMRHLRWWFKQPIFDRDGLLTVGYTYPNKIYAEVYNHPGSSYWAMKSFIPLSLSEDHPFWQAEEQPLPNLKPVSVQQHPWMVICNDRDQQHVLALTAGQYGNYSATHDTSKYAKFAYSNHFGFSVPRGIRGLVQGAFDSTLALSEEDDLYRTRRECEDVSIEGQVVYSRWKPWKDVEIKTWLVPAYPWHIRIHRIDTQRCIDTAEGGFSIEPSRPGHTVPHQWNLVERHGIVAKFPWGISGIVNLYGHTDRQMVQAHTHTNLIMEHTVIPTLTAKLKPGVHWLISAVVGSRCENAYESIWNNPPSLIKDGKNILISLQNENIFETSMD
jgi:hypothetical protein